ncbi:MAG: exodeoxyribonuclease VII small subunit [Bacteroidetes bacterium]|nr:exodeoxyribonuclease VII small subunit [Bacteroidota bacterium]
MPAKRTKKAPTADAASERTGTRTFEEALQRLEAIVDALEQGTVPLDRALELYQEGAVLTKECAERLKTAEQRIMKLSNNADGTFAESSLEDDE